MAAVPWRQARQDTGSFDVVAPPPPPPTFNGHIPTIRLKAEIPDTMDPPQCVQNAMMTKDKKPFTYTPGGIDLSEVRSPRMQRRIERNAHLGGVGDVPQHQHYSPQPAGPLPPSALAAMQPQIQVQVFPSGEKPVLPSKAAPPPPPPPCGPPPPPPPPSQPLPMQKCVTSDNQVLERPDMTKIIPENPMALLRKSPGPQRKTFVEQLNDVGPIPQQPIAPLAAKPQSPPNRRSFVDEVDNFAGAPQPPVQFRPVQNNVANRKSFVDEVESFSPPAQPQPRPFVQPQPKSPPTPVQAPPQARPQTRTSTVNVGSLYIPPANVQVAAGTPPTPPERTTPGIQSPLSATLNKAPRPWQKQQTKQEELPPWAVREPKSPPQEVEKQPSPPLQQQQARWPQKSPPLQQQPNRWVPPVENQNNYQQPQPVQQQQQRWPTQNASPPIRQQQLRSPPIQQQQQPSPAGANVVMVTQPLVFQHPGGPPPQQQQQQQKVSVAPRQPSQQPGVRIIPIKIESNQGGNSPTSPVTPGARSFNRQQSWSNNPTQSNSFRVIQKITNTDDEVDEDAPVTEHGPKTPRQFQQPTAQEQIRRMKINDGADRDLVNRFKQEVFISDEDPRYRGGHIPSRIFWMLEESGDEENTSSLHNEVDPRYRGAAIPSKAFRLLQSMTGPEDGSAPAGAATVKVTPAPVSSVPRTQPPNRQQPQVVRTIPVQIESDEPSQPYVHPSQQTPAPEPKKYTGGSIPSRSFKILQAMTAPDSANANYETSSNETWEQYPQNYPPPYYWHDYYWPYYYYPAYSDPNDPSKAAVNQDTEQEVAQYYAYPPPWYHYPYWGYPPYSPYPFYYPEGGPEEKNEQDCPTPQIVVTTDTETETENEDNVNVYAVNLQTIKSVSNIKVYDQKQLLEEQQIVEEVETDDSSDDDDDDDCQSVYVVDEDTNAHQLSTIYEESERSDRLVRESSVTTTVSEDFTYHAEEKKEVAEEDEEEDDGQDWWGIINNQSDSVHNDCDNTNTANDETGTVIEVAVQKKGENHSKLEEEDVDFWSEIIGDKDDKTVEEDSSASSSDSSSSMSKASKKVEDEEDDDDDTSSSSSSSSSSDDDDDNDDDDQVAPAEKEKSATPPSIKERIKALQSAEKSIQRQEEQEEEPPKISVKERISAFENQAKNKSSDDNSEEEMDSGVTSDVSRHTDTDEFPELRKMTKYQRAATHSRLFKLLQDECDNEDDEEVEEVDDRKARLQKTSERIAARSREHLTLPLKTNVSEPESFSSSGINSPGSGEFVNERLVNELIQSMLKRKKGQMLRTIPLEKLHAAAVRILQEDMDSFDTSSDDCSSFLSPLRTGTQSSTPAQTPQEFYNEYKQYYESWNEADASAEVFPSKAFKFLQEHKPMGVLPKCPRVLSSKSVNKELSKLLEGVESSPSPDKDDRREVTRAS